MITISRRDVVFLTLAGFFVANAVVGELIGGKLIQIGPFTMSVGVIPWPVVFISTDLINEYFGKGGVRRLTLLTAALIVYVFIVLYAAMQTTAAPFSPVTDGEFQAVFGQSMWIIVGSICAFLASQLVDVMLFWFFKKRTGDRLLWLRATGSTAISQLVDSFVIIGIAFWLPGKLDMLQYLNLSVSNYSYKLLIAIAITPLIYLAHRAIDHYLGKTKAEELMTSAVSDS